VNFPRLMIASLAILGIAPMARAGFTVNVIPDTTTPPTDAGLVAWNVYVVGSDGDKMACFDAHITGATICQVWASSDDDWAATAYNKSLTASGGKYRNDSHFCYDASNLLAPNGGLTEANDFAIDADAGKGHGDLWSMDDQGVINVYQSANALLARVVLPVGDTAALDLWVWNQNGEDKTHFTNVGIGAGVGAVPEPASMALWGLGGLALLRRKTRK
jgi:hypothetical protein